MLAQDVFVEFFVFLGEDDVVLQEIEELRDGAEALDLGLQLAHLLVLPVEEVAPHCVPAHAIGKADGIGGGEQLLADEQLGRFAVIAADLIDTQIDGFLLIGVLAFDHQHGDAVDQKDQILTGAVVTVVEGPLLGDFVDVLACLRHPVAVVVIDQDQITLALLLVIEELPTVAQVLDEFPVAVDVGVQMTELPEQRALGLGVARVEFAQLGVKQIVEEEGPVLGPVRVWGAWIKAAKLLGFFAGHNRPANRLGIAENPGLDGFVFSGFGH